MSNFKVFVFVLILSAESISGRPSVLTAEEGKRLIQVSETEPATWLSQDDIRLPIDNRVHFMDVTNRNYPTLPKDPVPTAFPTAMRFQNIVRETFPKISIPWMTDFVTQFSNFNNRYYNSQLGLQSSNWLLSVVEEGIAQSGYRGNASVRAYSHTWPQNSIIARIQGTESGVIILGAHQDSINSGSPSNGRAPGADDNASGSVAILETLLVLLESGFVPKKSIEFQWYAAEEMGLLGSQDIAQAYRSQNVDVVAMVNYDVVGYHVGRDQVTFITDYTDSGLTDFLRLVVDEYLTYTWVNSVCGYACSDHVSFNRSGFLAARAREAVAFPNMHTARDTIDQVNFIQVQEFVKLALAYIIELAEPVM